MKEDPGIYQRLLSMFCIMVFCFLVLLPADTAGQRRTYREAVEILNRQVDSLNAVIEMKDSDIFVLSSDIEEEKVIIKALRAEVSELEQELEGLEAKLAVAADENLHLDQSNRMLIGFNVLVGVFLLAILVFTIRKFGQGKTRKSAEKISEPETDKDSRFRPSKVSVKELHTTLDEKLSQLEKMGELKEKGLLTEDEFEKHKKTILE